METGEGRHQREERIEKINYGEKKGWRLERVELERRKDRKDKLYGEKKGCRGQTLEGGKDREDKLQREERMKRVDIREKKG